MTTTEITHLIHFSSMLLLLFAGNLTYHYHQLIMFYTEKVNVFYHVTLVNLVYPAKKKKIFTRTKPISQNKWIGHFRVSPAQASVPNEVKCSAFDMKYEMIFHSHPNKTKGCALCLILKLRVFGTWKWPISFTKQSSLLNDRWHNY